MAYILTKYEEGILERITRITGPIPEGYGILLIKYDAWFEYTNDVKMSIILRTLGNNEEYFSMNGGSFELVLAATKPFASLKQSNEPILPSIIKRPYPNRRYISLIAKNGRKHSEDGIPFLAKIEDLNLIDNIEFRIWDRKNLIDRQFEFPLKVSMTEENRFACLHFKDMTYFNRKNAEHEQQELREFNELRPNFTVLTYINVNEGSANTADWHWTYYDDLQEHLKHKYSTRFSDDKNINTWLSEPEVNHNLSCNDELLNPDSLFLGLSFYSELPNNIIHILGTKHPFVFST